MNKWEKFRGLVVFAGIIMLLSLAGCKSSKKVGTVESSGTKAYNEFFASMQEQEFNFNTLSARLNVDLNLPDKNMSSRVDLKMIKDSVFQLSVQPFLGIEVFRIELSIDSIKVIDRINTHFTRTYKAIFYNFYYLRYYRQHRKLLSFFPHKL